MITFHKKIADPILFGMGLFALFMSVSPFFLYEGGSGTLTFSLRLAGLMSAGFVFLRPRGFGSQVLLSPYFLLGIYILVFFEFIPLSVLYGLPEAAILNIHPSFIVGVKNSASYFGNRSEVLVLQFALLCLGLGILLSQLVTRCDLEERSPSSFRAGPFVAIAVYVLALGYAFSGFRIPFLDANLILAAAAAVMLVYAVHRYKTGPFVYIVIILAFVGSVAFHNFLLLVNFSIGISAFLLTRLVATRGARAGQWRKVFKGVIAVGLTGVVFVGVFFSAFYDRYETPVAQPTVETGMVPEESPLEKTVRVAAYPFIEKGVIRQSETGFCLSNIVERHWKEASGQPLALLAGLVPRAFWPEKPNVSIGRMIGFYYCGSGFSVETAGDMAATILGEPLIVAGQGGLMFAVAVLVALFAIIHILQATTRWLGTAMVLAVVPWLLLFEVNYSLYLASVVKALLFFLAGVGLYYMGRALLRDRVHKGMNDGG